jgi:hypothetical protein
LKPKKDSKIHQQLHRQGAFMNALDFLTTFDRTLNCWVDNNGIPVKEEESCKLQPDNSSKAKPPFLTEKSQIDHLISINGLSIEDIEKRARPGRFSQSGFIGKEEGFKDVLRKDWETVEKLQVTHSELAAHLSNIISIAKQVERNSKRNHSDPIVIEYRTKDLIDNTIASEAPQKLEVILGGTRGMQEDLFEPKDYNQRDVDTPEGWNEENIVKNTVNGITLNLNSGILSYIREFGFYEGGGDQNPYRVDPMKVMALLTGNV